MKRVTTRTTYKSRRRGSKKRFVIEKRFPNPIGMGVKSLIIAGVGTLAGYEITDMVDRWYATSAGTAPNAWYGSDAAHRIMQRATGMRMLVQVGVAAAFFGGAVLTMKRYPMIASGLAGGFIGSVVHLGHQLFSQRVWPMLSPTTKGNERIWGNRLYPAEQAKLLDLQDAAIAAQDKMVDDAKGTVAAMPAGQQPGGTGGKDPALLPDAYIYPATISYSAISQSRRVPGSMGAVPSRGQLPSPPPRIREMDLRQQQPQMAGAYQGEPQARPRGASTLSCGNCGRCTTCCPNVSPQQRSQSCTDDVGNLSVIGRDGTCIHRNIADRPCTDSNGNASVTGTDGYCIECGSYGNQGNQNGNSNGNGNSAGGAGMTCLDMTSGNQSITDSNGNCIPVISTNVPAPGGFSTAAPQQRIMLAGADQDRPAPSRAPSLESLASGGTGPHSTSSLLPGT